MSNFETAMSLWENRLKNFVEELSSGTVESLTNREWSYTKRKINVYPIEEDGRKKRGAQGPCWRSNTTLTVKEVEQV